MMRWRDGKKDDTEVLGLANVQLNPSPRQLLFQGFGNGHQTSGTVSEPEKLKFSNSLLGRSSGK